MSSSPACEAETRDNTKSDDLSIHEIFSESRDLILLGSGDEASVRGLLSGLKGKGSSQQLQLLSNEDHTELKTCSGHITVTSRRWFGMSLNGTISLSPFPLCCCHSMVNNTNERIKLKSLTLPHPHVTRVLKPHIISSLEN